MKRFIKPDILAMQAYTLKPYTYRHKMNQNENPFGYPEDLKAIVLERVAQADWARYPSFTLDTLREALAAHNGVRREMVLVGNGSNELIYVTLAATLRTGDHVVIPVPTFSVYGLLARVFGAHVHEIPMPPETNFALPVDAVIETAQRHQARVVVLCTPNNPTGTAYAPADVERVVAESGALVLIDEAYREFANQDFTPLLERYDNVVLLRTFSKAMAMGGLRVGYAITNETLARELHKAQLPYALNLFSETAALVAIEHFESHFRPLIERLKAERERLIPALNALPGLHAYPSAANFVLVRFDRPVREIFEALLNRAGILIRDVSGYPLLAGHLRISLGTPEENDLLVQTLAEILSTA
ncbi:MAG: histidinol-phosphate transaminase [Ardenticatenia bacterium]|nr:MAG: histidinol-phosphate transaminase [Ardenticatenia bacterium]